MPHYGYYGDGELDRRIADIGDSPAMATGRYVGSLDSKYITAFIGYIATCCRVLLSVFQSRLVHFRVDGEIGCFLGQMSVLR